MSVIVTATILRKLSPTDAAALWQVQHDTGTPVEAGLFETWLDESDANAEAWVALQETWAAFDDVGNALFADVRAAALAAAPTRHTRWWPAAAAAVIAVAGSGALILSRGTPSAPAETLVATADTVKSIALPDGSHITVSANSRIRLVFSGSQRRVLLDRGRALFTVRHDASRPFTVVAPMRTIVDLGTRFEVTVASAATQVSLYEGSVQVRGGGRTTVLQPGQKLIARAGQADTVMALAAATEALWREGLIQLDDATLAEAAEQVNAGARIKLVILDPRVAKLHVSGRFRRDPARFASTVTEILPVRAVRVAPDRIELRYRG